MGYISALTYYLLLLPITGPQSAHLWWPAMAKLQAASVLMP